MRLEIRSIHLDLDNGALDRIRGRFEHGLDHFAHHILGGCIVLSDVNGPKGGADKHCLVHLRLPWAPEVVIVEEGVELFSVVDRAIDRLAKAVGRAVGKIRHRRWQEYHRQQIA
jgi:ribosome-associated translation inhibitor RaiA